MDLVLNDKAEILDSKESQYDVSICIITYNKRPYIREAIESILTQKTTCRYEIVIGDNASTDGTTDILEDYWNSKKDIFCVIKNETDLGLSENMFNTIAKAKGKYVIILYGDDYWSDPQKLQVQYDHLEKNRDIIAVTAPVAFVYDGEDKAFSCSTPKFLWGKEIALKDYLNGYDFPMAGVMFRNDVFCDHIDHFKLMADCSADIDDASFCILLLMYGNVFIFPEIMSVYRCFKKDSGAQNFNSVNPMRMRGKKHIILFNELYRSLDGRVDLDMRYGLILASVFNSILHRESGLSDLKCILNEMDAKHKKIWFRCFMYGLFRKIELKARK